jgi:hypothetical protein
MTATLVLFALTVTPGGFVLKDIGDDQLARTAADEFEAGVKFRHDTALARPRFRESARMYDELWRRGFRNPDLALNRAHAHRLAGNLPASVAALHEGLSVARWDRPLQVALEDARGAVGYPLVGDLAAQCRPTPRATVGTRMSPVEAWGIAALLWLLACGGVARFAMTRNGWWLAFAGAWCAALALLGGLWLQDHRHRQRETADPLVVVTDDVVLRKGNADTFPARLEPKLPRGVEARELTRRGGWVQVRLAGGAIGWLPAASTLKVGE